MFKNIFISFDVERPSSSVAFEEALSETKKKKDNEDRYVTCILHGFITFDPNLPKVFINLTNNLPQS